MLQRWVADTVERFWPAEGTRPIAIDPKASPAKAVYDKIEELSPQSDAQRSLRSQALTMALDVGRTRLLLFEHLGTSIAVPFLMVLVFWLCIIFASFGLFATRNTTVITVLGVCALSVSGAIFIVLDMTHPLQGVIKVSSTPMRKALEHLGQ